MEREVGDRLPFRQVDVFTRVPFKGNPVAVVLEGDALTTGEMQAIARWTNLSETTFVCAPGESAADYRLRIFTPKSELPFAGHPTIGSAHAVLAHGRVPKRAGRLVQECARGLVDILIDDRIFFALPAPRLGSVDDAQLQAVVTALGIGRSSVMRAAVVDVGPIWLTVQLPDAAAVRAVAPDMPQLAALAASGVTGVNVFGVSASGQSAVEVRSFAPAEGIPEDPVCGSGNGCVAALVKRDGLVPGDSYVASQGACVGRDGYVAIRFSADGTIWVGGHSVTCVEGWLRT
jgi:PhzF family phenazine biosynthesis protein